MEINCWRYVQRSIDEVAPEVGGSAIYGDASKWHRFSFDNSGVVAWVFPMKFVLDPSIYTHVYVSEAAGHLSVPSVWPRRIFAHGPFNSSRG